LKRRRIQGKIRCMRVRDEVLVKYHCRGRNRFSDIYHKAEGDGQSRIEDELGNSVGGPQRNKMRG